MKKASILIPLLFILLSYSCNSLIDSCDGIACFTPGQIFYFELLDSETNENLFTNGTYNSSELTIIATSGDSEVNVDFDFIDENSVNQIQLHATWGTEIVNYAFKINETILFNLYVDAESVSEDCCSFTRYNEIKVEDIAYNIDEETGVYNILID